MQQRSTGLRIDGINVEIGGKQFPELARRILFATGWEQGFKFLPEGFVLFIGRFIAVGKELCERPVGDHELFV